MSFSIIYQAIKFNIHSHFADPINLTLGVGTMFVNNIIAVSGSFFMYFGSQAERNGDLLQYFFTLQAICLLGYASVQFVASGLSHLGSFIDDGSIESWMSTPRSSLLLISIAETDITAIGDFLLGVIFTIFGSILWGPIFSINIIQAALIAALGFSGTFIIGGTLGFFLKRGGVLQEFLIFSTISFSTQPSLPALTGKSRWLLLLSPALITTVLPVETVLNAGFKQFLISWIIAIIFFIGSVQFYKFGSKYYQSANYLRHSR
jgi:ABC-type uncharacterized transport system permease subunit